MRATAAVLYFGAINEREKNELAEQCERLRALYGDVAEFLDPIPVGSPLPAGADAVVFPQLIGAAFSEKDALGKIDLPIVVLTSEFGTVEMWDWEIITFLREEAGLNVFSPYTLELGKCILRAIACKKQMRDGLKFLMFQDSPGEGMQAYIFKRFYWWESACTKAIEEAFGVQIIYRSYRELNERAKAVPDSEAQAVADASPLPTAGVTNAKLLKAVKLYVAVKREIDEIGGVKAVGANCLNESESSDTTPCAAWNLLWERDKILWACEGDTVTLISMFILYSVLQAPMMMTNIYPFLVGMAALKHEKIERFPEIPNSDNHALGVHCGYFGLMPPSFSEEYVVRPKVLEIVGEDALMVDCRMQKGPVTLAKLHPNMKKMTVIACEITDYVQYPGSDCRNGALLHYRNDNGHQIMEALSSHHALIIQGDQIPALRQMGKVFGFDVEFL